MKAPAAAGRVGGPARGRGRRGGGPWAGAAGLPTVYRRCFVNVLEIKIRHERCRPGRGGGAARAAQ